MDSGLILILSAGVFLFAGFVKGVIGGGLPTIGIGLMGLVIPPAHAAALIVLPSLITNIWQSFGRHFKPLMRRLWLLFVSICVGSLFGAGVMTGADAGLARAGLGVTLLIYATLGLLKVRFHLDPRGERRFVIPIGLMTGAIGAATGVFVIPSGPFLQAIGLNKDELVQALGLTYLVSTVALAGALFHGGAMQSSVAVPSVVALVASMAGMAVGQRFRARLHEQMFLRLFYIGLLVVGGYMVLRAVL